MVAPPATPPMPQATAGPTDELDAGQVLIAWDEPADGGRPITHYAVQQADAPLADGTHPEWVVAGTAESRELTVSSLRGRTVRQFRVVAVNDVGEGAPSPAVIVTVPDKPAAPETPLAALPSDGVTAGEIELSWTRPDDGGSPITSYVVERLSGVGDWEPLAETTQLSFSDARLASRTRYSYRVSAVNLVGTGPPSPAVAATALDPPNAPAGVSAAVAPAPGVAPGQVHLGWAAPASGADTEASSYRLEFRVGDGVWEVLGTTSDHVFTATTTTAGQEYQFRVVATNAAGDSEPSLSVTATAVGVPAAPPAPDAEGAPAAQLATGEIRISWAPPDDGGSPITEYVIERLDGDGAWETVGETADLSFVDSGRTVGVAYTYRVQAVNIVGAGPPSATVEGSALDAPSPPRNCQPT